VVTSAGTECRAAAGDCDVAEQCTGTAGQACPSDSVSGAFLECRPVAGPCDVAENCDGVNVNCPADGFEPATEVCRASAGDCDPAENCTGSGAACPADAKSTAVCRPTAGICDVAESCDGIADDCPADGFEPATEVCRPAVDVCDLEETCTGSSATCPADLMSPDGDDDGVCDQIDICPVDPDPGQEDGDLDGQGDACDPCTNLLPSFADRHKVILSRLDAPAGTHKLKASGRCEPFLETPPPDPETNGIRLVLEDAAGNVVLDELLPGGAYDPFTRAGWRVHSFPQGMTASYKNSDAGFANGLRTVKFVWKIGQGITKFTVVGKDGTYPVAPGDQPVKFILVIDTPVATTGQCCEAYFLPSPHPDDQQPDGRSHTTGDCSFKGVDKTLTCKWKSQVIP